MSRSTFDNAVIEDAGIYPLASGEQITVGIAPDHIVEFRLLDASGAELLRSNERASALHRWELYWDSQRSLLWFNSSDVGKSVWAKGSSGSFEQTWISNGTPEWAALMPKRFFDDLPASLQGDWAPLRDPPR